MLYSILSICITIYAVNIEHKLLYNIMTPTTQLITTILAGVVHIATGQYASAFHYFSTAINLQPTYARAYTYLAISLAKLEDFDNSCAAYEKSIELSDDCFTLLNYSITLFSNDEIEKAKKQFQRYEVAYKKQHDSGHLATHRLLYNDCHCY